MKKLVAVLSFLLVTSAWAGFRIQSVSEDFGVANSVLITGNGDGAIRDYCVSSGGGVMGQSTCTCAFYFRDASSATVIEEATLEHHDEWVRCSTASLKGYGVRTVKVRLHHVSGSYSNELRLRLAR